MPVRKSSLAIGIAAGCVALLATAAGALAQSVPPPPTVQQLPPEAGNQGSPPRSARAANEQLFNAINANDLERVKQAVQAGADVGARNAFGTTAVDLAVDLGRYDIAFYLMSFRSPETNERTAQPRQAQPEPAQPAPAVGGFSPSFRLTPQPTMPVTRGEIREQAPEAPVIATPQAPPVPPGADPSGGEPVPSKGFVGFGPGRDGAKPPG